MFNPNGIGKAFGTCGEFLQVSLMVNDDEITEARFCTNARNNIILCGEIVTILAKGSTISKVKGLTADKILEIGGLSDTERYYAELAEKALGKAIESYINSNLKGNSELSISYKERKEHLNFLQSLPLKQKIRLTNFVIKEALDKHERPVIAWSGGKDSTVLLFLSLRQKPDIDVVWINTGVEYPECVKFIRKISSEWKLNFHEAKPEMTFWQVVEKYGYPFFGKGNSRGYWFNRVNLWKRKGRNELARIIEVTRASTECCRILKERPASKIYQKLNTDCILLGNIVSESHQRFLIWAKKGGYFYSSSEKRWKVWPLSIWTEGDVWKYHELYNIPYCSIYDKGHRRNGCWPCLMDIKFPDNHLQSLRRSHPKLWRFLIRDKGLGEVILALKQGLDAKELKEKRDRLKAQVEELIEKRPCYFDKL